MSAGVSLATLQQLVTEPIVLAIEDRAHVALVAGSYRSQSGRSGLHVAASSSSAGAQGVSVIELSGPLSYRGGVDYESIATAVRQAAADPSTKSIVLRIDSPGGDAALVDIAGGAIREANKVKPVTAFVDPHAFSAAYWLASQAGRVVMAPGAMVGSVGVIARHFDVLGLAEQFGVKVTEFVYGDKKNIGSMFRRADATTAAEVERILNVIGEDFVEAVAKGRRIGVDAVRKTEAAIFTGAEALNNGFADTVTSFDDLLAGMRGGRVVSGGGNGATAIVGNGADRPTQTKHIQGDDAMSSILRAVQLAHPNYTPPAWVRGNIDRLPGSTGSSSPTNAPAMDLRIEERTGDPMIVRLVRAAHPGYEPPRWVKANIDALFSRAKAAR